MKVEKLEGENWVLWYTHAVYYRDANDNTHKFFCVAKDELDAYHQATIERNLTNVIRL
jgi:hypothetical protein